MCNRIEKHNTDAQENVVFECMDDFFSRMELRYLENVLRDNLKADMGNDNASGKHSASETNHQVVHTASILQFLRALPAELSNVNTNDIEQLKTIQNRFHEFDYDSAYDVIFRGLGAWIFQDEDLENACIEYVLKIAKVYNEARELLEMCWEYYQSKRNTELLKGVENGN